MIIAVAGASGRLGVPLTAQLEAAGHQVRRLHRGSATHPVDLRTGAGLARALDGVEVVIHAANTLSPRRARALLVDGSARLLAASAPGAHHVGISIVGVQRFAKLPGYYAAKVEQDRRLAGSGHPFSILAATQFQEWVGAAALAAARWGIELRSPIPLAPVAVDEVAARLARLATGAPHGGTLTMCGPETLTVTALRARRGVPVRLPAPGAFGRALRDGALIEPDPDVRGARTYAAWLAQARGRPWRPGPSAARGS